MAAVKAEIDAATARLRCNAVRRPVRGALHHRWRSHGVGKPGDRDPQSDRAAADRSSTTPTAGCSPTFIWARRTKVRQDTCTGVSRRWSSTMCSEKWRPMQRTHASPAPSRCATCAPPGWDELHAEAANHAHRRVKAYAAGHLADDEGITVEARGRVHPAEVGSRLGAMPTRLRVIVAISETSTRAAPLSPGISAACVSHLLVRRCQRGDVDRPWQGRIRRRAPQRFDIVVDRRDEIGRQRATATASAGCVPATCTRW